MSSQKSGISLIKQIFSDSFRSLLENPRIFQPFLFFALAEFAALILLYNIPREPLIKFLGPPIRTFWGEIFLHYPSNFLLLPKLSALSRMFLAIFFGSFTTGAAVAIIIKAKHAYKLALRKYASLFVIVLIYTAIYYFLQKAVFIGLAKYFIAGHSKLLFLKSGIWLGPVLFVINFLMAIVVQAFFVYAIPALIIDEKKFFPAIMSSFRFCKKYFLVSFGLVGLPLILYVPIAVFNYNASVLMTKLFPEVILLIAVMGIVIASLIIDLWVTLCATLLFKKEK
ncbi:MAG: hypothetical protein PHG68_01285 [Candidatus Omnitrophica bacterium]|nr:hypothetical protein [Candidatus Omnitrophota bacterium]